jgi:hypothetical protein
MPKYPDITVKLVGEDGNAFAIMNRTMAAMPADAIGDYHRAAMSGDYDNVLRVTMETVTTE